MRVSPLVLALAALPACRRVPVLAPRTRDWAPALQGHTVRDGDAPAALAYRAPRGCRLAYEWVARVRMFPGEAEAREGLGPQGIEARGVAEGEADAGGTWTLGVRYRELAHLMGEVRAPASRDEGIAAPMLLRTDGRGWREEDGPTATWSAYGTFPGLVRFFPTLPATPRAGSFSRWRYRVHGDGAGIAVEVRRGGVRLPPGMVPPPAQGTERQARARVARWLRVDGAPVAVIETEGREDDASEQTVPGMGSVTTRSERRTLGEHLVLASTGRLLFARYDDDATVRMRLPGREMVQRQTVHAELRLVGACDGPTMRSAIPPRGAEERALDAIVALRNAMAAEDRAAALAALSPSLRARHGDEALYATLRRHVRRHGPRSLGTPEIPMANALTRTPDGAVRVVSDTLAEHAGTEDRALTVDTEFELDVGDGPAKVRRIRSFSVHGAAAPDLLDVSTEALTTDAPPDPAP